MKIKLKFGDHKIKIAFPGNLKQYEDMFGKANLEYFKGAYDGAPASIFNYYKGIGKAFEKYVNLSMQQASDSTVYDENTMPANGHDIYNYVARYGMANFQIEAVLKLDNCLDYERLKRAVRLSVDAEPVFGCRFVENEPPYWKRISNLDNTVFCTFESAQNMDESVLRFLESPLDMDKDPMVKLKLIRSGGKDALVIKVNHACCDGTGLKDYISLLSDIYTHMDEEGFCIKENPRTRNDQDRLFNSLGISDPETAWVPGSEILSATWVFPWKYARTDNSRIAITRLPSKALGTLTDYSKSKGATINDLILTAFYRSMKEMGQPIYGEPMEIAVTVDLRRYLPDGQTEAIRNFSGSVTAKLPVCDNETFADTLSRVVQMMGGIKKDNPGLQSAIGLERIEKMSFRDTLAYFQVSSQVSELAAQCPPYSGDKCIPSLSNLGFISKSLIRFGENTVIDSYIVPPVVRAPGLLLMISTYNSILTLAAGYYEESVAKADVERLLNKVKDELLTI